MKEMPCFICLWIFLASFSALACVTPSEGELRSFFEGSPQWTEVREADDARLAEKRPVHLKIGFKDTLTTMIKWGDNVIKGTEIQICWYSEEKKSIRIKKGFFRITLIKVKEGLLKSWIPFDGDLFYRKDHEVIRATKNRGLAEDPI